MKIIAKTKDGFVLQADEHEVARLIGFYAAYDCRDKLVEGAEIEVNQMFMQLYKVKAIKSNVKEIITRANELVEAIRIKSPVTEPIVAAIESAEPKKAI